MENDTMQLSLLLFSFNLTFSFFFLLKSLSINFSLNVWHNIELIPAVIVHPSVLNEIIVRSLSAISFLNDNILLFLCNFVKVGFALPFLLKNLNLLWNQKCLVTISVSVSVIMMWHIWTKLCLLSNEWILKRLSLTND